MTDSPTPEQRFEHALELLRSRRSYNPGGSRKSTILTNSVDDTIEEALLMAIRQSPPPIIGAHDYDKLLGELEDIDNYEGDVFAEIVERATFAIRDLLSVAVRPSPPPLVPFEMQTLRETKGSQS